ncbi:MAG: lipopolysaccharide biosynthesis protein [wastewater metagenome]|nr:lipopolysaccharide biosynthesis protein [Candidatus Loosdrechtia aerotolerans]
MTIPVPSKKTDRTSQSIIHRTLSGFSWTFSGTGVRVGLELLVMAVLARLLTPRDFGVVAVAVLVVRLAEVFAQIGIGPAIVQRIDLKAIHMRAGFTISWLSGLFLMFLVSFLAPQISSFFQMEELIPVVRVTSIVFFFHGICLVAESLLQREFQFRWLAIVQVVSYAIGYGGAGICFAFLGFGVWSLVFAFISQMVVKSIFLLIIKHHPMRPSLERRAVADLMYFGGGFTLSRIGNAIAGQGDYLVVGRWLGADALGFYGRAYQLMTIPAMLFAKIIDTVLFPAMAKIQMQQDRLRTAYRRGVALIALIVLPASATAYMLSPEIITVVFGPKWLEAVVPFKIFAMAILFRTSYKMSDSLARATGAVYKRAWRQGVYAALVLGGAIIGQYWGIHGVAYGVFFAIVVNFILMAHLSLAALSLSWKEFFVVHVSALPLTAIVLLEVFSITTVLRNAAMPALVILASSMVCVLVTITLLFYLSSKSMLGRDGIWMLQTLSNYIPNKINPFKNRAAL